MSTPNRPSSDLNRPAFEAEVAALLGMRLEEITGGKVTEMTQNVAVGDDRRTLSHVLCLEALGKHWTLAVETLREAYPRDVREAVWTLDEFAQSFTSRGNEDLICFVAADTLSSGAKEILRKRGIGHFDLDGSLWLRHLPLMIDIERPPRRRSSSKELDLFTDAREAVVHVLLKMHDHPLTGVEIAEEAKTSQYTCSVVLRELERREWLETTGSGRSQRRRLSQPGKLLDAWAESWANRRDERSKWFAFAHNPGNLVNELAQKLPPRSPDFALFTGAAAGNSLAPLLTSVETVDLVIPKGKSLQVAAQLQLKPAEKGSNVTLIERDGTSLQNFDPRDSAYFVSPYVAYLDLLDGKGRNKELAEHVRRHILDI